MTPIVKETWDLLHAAVSKVKEADEKVSFDSAKYEAYRTRFEQMYTLIRDSYMKPGVRLLDRHKTAAIVVICQIEARAVFYEGEPEGNARFMGNYILPLNVGLSYMLTCLNQVLKEAGSPKTLERYIFPKAMACPTDLLDVMARNLFYIDGNSEWSFNPLDLAERFFWLESYSLKSAGIDEKYVRGRDKLLSCKEKQPG